MDGAYFDRNSYRSGDTARLCVSAQCSAIDIELFRQGKEDQPVWSRKDIPVQSFTLPADVVENGCAWPVAVELPLPANWRGGFYLARLKPAGRRSDQALLAGFVLRPASPRHRILLCLTTSTWEAYNDFGGANTYSSGGVQYQAGARRVSRNRPLSPGFLQKPAGSPRIANTVTLTETVPFAAWAVENGISPWSGAAGWWNWEYPFVRWAEAEGIGFDYACSSDLHTDPDLLRDYGLFISVGHDEYWSWEMRDQVEAFIARGGNAIFLGGNTAFWQVRWTPAGDQMTAFKSAFREDPLYGTGQQSRTSGLWSNPVTGRPENQMTGLSFCRGGYARMAGCSPKGAGGYLVYRPEHWVFEGTGLRHGDLIGARDVIVGYEVDGCEFDMVDGRPRATGGDGTPDTFEILGLAPASLMSRETAIAGFYPDGALSDLELVADQLCGGTSEEALRRFRYGHAVMGLYQRGGTVFNAGCTEWACALAGGDPDIVQITRTLLRRLAPFGTRPV